MNQKPLNVSLMQESETAPFDWAAIGQMVRAQALQAFGLHLAATSDADGFTQSSLRAADAEQGEAA